MSTSTIQEIELNIQQAKKIVDLGDAMTRLLSNRDFKKIFLEGYFKDEAVRLVHLKADFNMQEPERQANLIRMIDAIGITEQYCRTITMQADMANKAMQADEETRDELLAAGE